MRLVRIAGAHATCAAAEMVSWRVFVACSATSEVKITACRAASLVGDEGATASTAEEASALQLLLHIEPLEHGVQYV